MMCKACNIDMAVRSVTHEITKQGEELSLTLLQQLACPKCNAEQTIYTPLPTQVKNV